MILLQPHTPPFHTQKISKQSIFQQSFTAKLKSQRCTATTPSISDENIHAELRSTNPVDTLKKAVSVVERTLNNVPSGKPFAKTWEKIALFSC